MSFAALISRFPYPSRSAARALGIAAIVTQAGIGVTGSVVRVTGSGLGCPTWPTCHQGSMIPVEHPEYALFNQWIEFGNRLLTIIVVLVAALCLIAALRIKQAHPHRTRLLLLASAMPGGVVIQAVIGGITVLTELLWWTVAIHFLASSVLVWLAVLLLHAFAEDDQEPRWLIGERGRTLLVLLGASLAALLVAGTLVTGAGPHGGDPDVERFDAPIDVLARIHGGFLVVFLAVLAVLGLVLLRSQAPRRFIRRYLTLWAVALAQGVLGTVQYELGVPEELVSLHVLGSALVVIATASLWCSARDRGPAPRRPRDTEVADHVSTASSGVPRSS